MAMTTSELREAVEAVLLVLTARATGEGSDEPDYARLRRLVVEDPRISAELPSFVRTCRTLGAFWGFIKPKFRSYAERRLFLDEQFEPSLAKLDALERNMIAPSTRVTLGRLDSELVRFEWAKAVERTPKDPEGAITIARTLLESVCKRIIHDLGGTPGEKWDLPKLYREASERLNLAPAQHSEESFRTILGGCAAVVNGLGTLRNRLGDAHGKGAGHVRPQPRHASLAVSLAGAMATFLIETMEVRREPMSVSGSRAAAANP